MSANAWRARRGDPEARDERRGEQSCRKKGCVLNRRRHYAHLVFTAETAPSWARGTNRRGRRAARKKGHRRDG